MFRSPPSGTVDRLFAEARLLREVEAAAVKTLSESGFEEVILPLLERADVFSSEGAVRFVDRHGEVLGLRADFTGQVARLVSTRLRSLKEVRLCYRGVVFHDVDAWSGDRRQLHQAGFEYFDDGEVAGEVEIIRRALAVCDAAGVGKTRVSIGSAALIHALCPDAGPEVRTALDRRDAGALPPSLLPLLELTGNASALERARRVLPPAATPALDRLSAVFAGLGPDAGRADIDLAEVRPWAYYSGMVFDVFAEGARGAVAGGGRYQGLASRYGDDRPAVGASVDIDAIVELRSGAAGALEAGPRALTVALPKGRIRKSVLRQLGALGPLASELDTRKLVLEGQAPLPSGARASFLLVKDSDVPEYVERGVADLGFVGLDVLSESPSNVLQPLVTALGRCRMCLCGRPGTKPAELAARGSLKVASKYPHTARHHLEARGLPAEIIPLQGSVELAVVTGLADVIVDMVETGATLEANGLVVLEDLMESTARAVVNRGAWRLKAPDVQAVLQKMKADPV
ncbi:MAG TPA: ATP phosphoribosyltransferase [Myxococcaceae bacterium]|nr:ATP phosphoribosyltransferase [Myxococcaceae bacterium]